MAIDLNTAVFGIDVSHHNVIDWQVLAKNQAVQFCYIKASEGMTYRDPKFAINARSAIELGVPCGAYHFARPDNNTARQDADNFLGAIDKIGGQDAMQLRPCLDMEVGGKAAKAGITGQKGMDWLQGWIDRVLEVTGEPTLYYGGPNSWYSMKMPKTWHPQHAMFWRAKYPNNKTQTLSLNTNAVQLYATGKYQIEAFPDWPTRVWQYSGYGQVSGVLNRCDCNITDEAGLAEMTTSGSGAAMAGGAALAIGAAALWWAMKGKK